jgi:hypothetical protein
MILANCLGILKGSHAELKLGTSLDPLATNFMINSSNNTSTLLSTLNLEIHTLINYTENKDLLRSEAKSQPDTNMKLNQKGCPNLIGCDQP